MRTIAVFGGGNIGAALLGGLVAAGRSPDELVVVEASASRAADLHDRLGVTVSPLADAVRAADVAVVAVKPPDVASLLDDVTSAAGSSLPLVISLAAGLPTAVLESHLPDGAAVVRVMPNTPMLVNKAMSVLSPGSNAGDEELAVAEEILGAVGRTVRVPEHQQDAATALSGSGPGYVFLLAEAMIEAGVAQGLPRATATTLVTTAVEGAGALMNRPGEHPGLLREAVTSPGGTTAAALRALEAHGLRAALADAVEACRDRSVALGEQLGKHRSS